MNRTHSFSSFRRGGLVAAALLFAAGAVSAQAAPDLYGRYRGTGYFEIRGTDDKRALSEASIDLRPSGAIVVTIRGRNVDFDMTGRAVEWTGRHQMRVVLDLFDGQATNVDGWIRFDDARRFERIELGGRQPHRIGISFTANGPNLAGGRPAPPVVQPPIGQFELTEEPGTIRRGTELGSFRTGFVRDCAAACRNDDRCEGYTWLASETTCYTLATVSAGEANRNATSGVKRRATSGTAGFDVRSGTNQTGRDFSDVATPTAEACQASCSVNARCRAFTYNQQSGICYLKETVGEFRSSTGRVSGARRD